MLSLNTFFCDYLYTIVRSAFSLQTPSSPQQCLPQCQQSCQAVCVTPVCMQACMQQCQPACIRSCQSGSCQQSSPLIVLQPPQQQQQNSCYDTCNSNCISTCSATIVSDYPEYPILPGCFCAPCACIPTLPDYPTPYTGPRFTVYLNREDVSSSSTYDQEPYVLAGSSSQASDPYYAIDTQGINPFHQRKAFDPYSLTRADYSKIPSLHAFPNALSSVDLSVMPKPLPLVQLAANFYQIPGLILSFLHIWRSAF